MVAPHAMHCSSVRMQAQCLHLGLTDCAQPPFVDDAEATRPRAVVDARVRRGSSDSDESHLCLIARTTCGGSYPAYSSLCTDTSWSPRFRSHSVRELQDPPSAEASGKCIEACIGQRKCRRPIASRNPARLTQRRHESIGRALLPRATKYRVANVRFPRLSRTRDEGSRHRC